MKLVANEIFGIFEKYKDGKCSYDRALEDVSKVIETHADNKPIVGYVKSNTIKKVLNEVIKNKKVNSIKSYIYDCQIHQNEIEDIQRILKNIS